MCLPIQFTNTVYIPSDGGYAGSELKVVIKWSHKTLLPEEYQVGAVTAKALPSACIHIEDEIRQSQVFPIILVALLAFQDKVHGCMTK